MAEFTDNIIKRIFNNEGVIFENDPNDEPTKYGLVASDIRECVADGIFPSSALDNIVEFIKNMDSQTAKNGIKHQYFDKLSLSKIIYQEVAEKICDMSMPMGRKRAVICAQRACRSVTAGDKELDEDGVMGPNTLSSINICFNRNFLCAFRSECAAYYRLVAQSNPNKDRYLQGWLNRAYQ